MQDSATAKAALDSFTPTSSADLLTQAQSKYGVQDLQSRVQALRGLTSNLTNSIAAVDPSVTGRTSGTLTTEAQRSAIVNRERQPLIGDLNTENSALSGAQGDLNTNESMADQLAQSLAQDQTNKYNKLKDTYDTSYQREQDTKAAQDKASQEAESVREFNVSSSSKASGAAAKPLNQTQVVSAIKQGLESVKGGDGHVAPADLAKAYNDFTQSGLDPNSFWKYFQGYWNPNQGNYKQQFNAAR